MTVRQTIPGLGVLLLFFAPAAYAQAPELKQRIQTGVDLIKLGCGTGRSEQKVEISGGAGGSLTLKAPPSLQAGGNVLYSKTEAQGLVAALQKEVSEGSLRLSEKQIDCMKPYIDAIFKELFPGGTQPRSEAYIRLAHFGSALGEFLGENECVSIRHPLGPNFPSPPSKNQVDQRTAELESRIRDFAKRVGLSPHPRDVLSFPSRDDAQSAVFRFYLGQANDLTAEHMLRLGLLTTEVSNYFVSLSLDRRSSSPPIDKRMHDYFAERIKCASHYLTQRLSDLRAVLISVGLQSVMTHAPTPQLASGSRPPIEVMNTFRAHIEGEIRTRFGA